MLEKFIKKDKNEELEKILEEKNIDEQAKNLLQGILYKVEVSYKDYKIAKVKEMTEEKYVEEILRNIQRKCKQIKIIKLSEKIEETQIQNELEKNKFYILNDEIISYPIEEKILYAIEKRANNAKIVNNKYGIVTTALSNLINEGKSIDRIEALRDFNGWSWTTIKSEIESIKANLVYQTLQILLGEEFINSWSQDTDGIIDYMKIMHEEMMKKYGEILTEQIIETLKQIAIINESEENPDFKMLVSENLERVEEKMEKFNNTQENIIEITKRKKEAAKEIKDIEKILSQESRLKEEYEKRNAGVEMHKKIFSIRVLKQQLNERKQKLLNEIEDNNYLLNPANYLKERNEIGKQKELLEVINFDEKQKEDIIIKFEKTFLQCYEEEIAKQTEPENIMKLIYKFRYFMLLPFNMIKDIRDVEELRNYLFTIEDKLSQIAIEKKVINKVPIEIMRHVFETRIIVLEELYFKITTEFEKCYVQIFDENITEEKFEIMPTEKMKINKKIKIFI